MNIRLTGPALEKALADKLLEILESVPWLRGKAKVEQNPAPQQRVYDILASIPLSDGSRAEWWVECRAEPRPSQFPTWSIPHDLGPEGRRATRIPTLGAPYITPNMARVCQDKHWDWFDLAGNCYLSVANGIHLERSGNDSVVDPPKPKANLGTREASRVIRAILNPAHAGERWTQRELEGHFVDLKPKIPEPSLSLINKVVQHLRDEAYIEICPDGGFILKKPLELLDAWRDAYRFDRHVRRSYFTLLQGPELARGLARLDAFAGGRAVLASFSAASRQAPNVRQPRHWFFVAADLEDEFARCLQAKPVDSGENLVVLIPDDEGVFYEQEAVGDGLACTHPVQTYVDVFHSGGRGHEAAEALLEYKLKPAWHDLL